MYSLSVSAGEAFRKTVAGLGPYPTAGAAAWAAGAVRAWLHSGRADGWLAAHPRQIAAGVLGLFWDILEAGEDPRTARVEVSADAGRPGGPRASYPHRDGVGGLPPGAAAGHTRSHEAAGLLPAGV